MLLLAAAFFSWLLFAPAAPPGAESIESPHVLIRLVFSYVVGHGFSRFSAAIVPKFVGRTPEQAAEQKRLAAAKLETFRFSGLMEAASEQAVGTVGQLN
jgi:hypothetical protein